MKTVHARKAQPVSRDYEVPDVWIRIDVPIADQGSLEEHRVFFDHQASELEDALFGALPGGTYDRLLCKMLERKASLFVVTLGYAGGGDR